MSKQIGFVCGTKSDAVKFFLDKAAQISFGQIVRIDSANSKFYARVVDAESSSTLQTTEQLRHASGKEVFGPYSCFRSVEAVLFFETKYARLRSIQTMKTRCLPLRKMTIQFLNLRVR
jgi:hypothetical protein